MTPESKQPSGNTEEGSGNPERIGASVPGADTPVHSNPGEVVFERLSALERQLKEAQGKLAHQRELARVRQQRRREARPEEMRAYWAEYKRAYRARETSWATRWEIGH